MASPPTDDGNDHGPQVRLTAECLCHQHKFTATVPKTALPLQATTCHCDSCRRFTGALYSIDAPWAGDPAPIRDATATATLRWYDFSANLKILFCGTCSAPLFWESPLRDPATGDAVGRKFTVFVGALSHDSGMPLTTTTTTTTTTGTTRKGGAVVEVGTHMFVGDTKDGGASMWMRGMNGEGAAPVKRFRGVKYESDELAWDWPGVGGGGGGGGGAAATFLTGHDAQKPQQQPQQQQQQQHEEEDVGQDQVPIRCHCGGVDLVFSRKEAEREWTAKAADELPRIVDPASRKYVAGLDACDSCRLSFGSEVAAWAFVFLRHVGFPRAANHHHHPDGHGHLEGITTTQFPDTLQDLRTAVTEGRLGTLAVYQSSDRIQRYFCSRCSACVFYANEKRTTTTTTTTTSQPAMVDLALGVLRAEEGARAEKSFHWLLGGPQGLQHRQDMVGGWRRTWLEAVEAEAEAWRQEKGVAGVVACQEEGKYLRESREGKQERSLVRVR